jgi:AP-2 complex subunit mu-1
LAATKSNVNVAMILQFLYSIIAICKSYFKGDFDEKCIKENFVLIYELLDGNKII